MTSIRSRLFAGSIGAMLTLLIGSGVFLFFMVRATLIRHFDKALLDQAEVLMAAVEVKAGRVIFDDEDLDMGEFNSEDGPAFLQILTHEGNPIFSSLSLAGRRLGYVLDESDRPVTAWIDLPRGRRGRAVYANFVPRIDDEDAGEIVEGGAVFDGKGVELVFARDTADVLETLGQLELILLVFGAGTIALAGAMLHSVINRSLTPLDALAASIHAVRPDALSETISLRECPSELKPVVERLNELLDRLGQAFNRERAFSADVAHELRTPLAGIRSTIEVALSRDRGAPEYATALRECLAVADDMQTMAENLLTLARLESGEFDIVAEDVSLNSLVESIVTPMRPQFSERNISLYLELENGVTLRTDSALLHIAARNLLENALDYTDEGGRATVYTSRNGANAKLRVTNTGSRVDSGEVANVCNRFWRADTARSGARGHVGLGLALVQKIVSTLGGTVEVASSGGGEFSITVTLPERRNNE